MSENQPQSVPTEPASLVQRLRALTRSQSWQWRYGVAACVVLAAFMMRLWMFGGLDNRVPFGFFLLAVMIVAWYGGLGPGLFAAAAGLLLLGGYFFVPRADPAGGLSEATRTSITLYVINSTLVSFLMDNLHTRVKKLQDELKRLTSSGGMSS